jgi:hypothetical protein
MIHIGQRWREKATGRIIVILQEEVHGTGPAWHYENESHRAWHYCCIEDFVIWDRFEPLEAS